MTTEAKWTPGQWVAVSVPQEGVECFWTAKAKFEKSWRDRLASVDGPQNETQQANANLIAAAPDMAEALKPFEALAKHGAADSSEWRDFDSISVMVTIGDLRAVCAALAKARGEAQ